MAYSGIFLAGLRTAGHVSQISWYLDPNLNKQNKECPFNMSLSLAAITGRCERC